MTARESVALLLAQAREDGILASRLAVRTQATIDALIDLERQLAHQEELAARKLARKAPKGELPAQNDMNASERQLITNLARLLDSLRAKNCGWHGSGRHIGEDFELCSGYDGSDGTPARPCSPRCAAVAGVLDEAANYLGVQVEDLRGWPKRMRTA